jgi:hypothetical protein
VGTLGHGLGICPSSGFYKFIEIICIHNEGPISILIVESGYSPTKVLAGLEDFPATWRTCKRVRK